MGNERRMSRRRFLRLSALATLGILSAACSHPIESQCVRVSSGSAAKPSKFTCDFTVYAGDYTPNSARTWGGVEPVTREALTAIAGDWVDLHPTYKLRFVEAPALLPLDTWITSQIFLETGPDILTSPQSYLNGMAALGTVVPLNDYLALPNIYAQDAAADWGSLFSNSVFATAGPRGILGGVPLDRAATGIYANRTLLERAGIDLDAALVPGTGAPADWRTLLAWCASLKALKVEPFSMATSLLDSWLMSIMVDQLLWGLTDRLDLLNYHPTNTSPHQVGQVSVEEILLQITCNGWRPFREPAVRNMFELIKEFKAYLPVGSETTSIMSYSWDDFMNGRLALLWEGCWLVRDLAADALLPFEWTGFWFPPVTNTSSPFVRQPPIAPLDIGAFSSSVGINIATLQRNNLEECLDWLMLNTTPANNGRLVNEVPMLLPSIRGAGIPAEMAQLLGDRLEAPIAAHPWLAPIYWLGINYNPYVDTLQRAMALYLLDESSMDKFLETADQAISERALGVVYNNAVQYNPQGTWDLTQWPYQPQV